MFTLADVHIFDRDSLWTWQRPDQNISNLRFSKGSAGGLPKPLQETRQCQAECKRSGLATACRCGVPYESSRSDLRLIWKATVHGPCSENVGSKEDGDLRGNAGNRCPTWLVHQRN